MGCGTGLLSIIAAKAGGRVISTEIDPVALALTKKNTLANQVKLDIRTGSLCRPLFHNERINWCICNLPQKPGSLEDGLPIAQCGGPEGDLLMVQAVSGLRNHQQSGDKLLFYSHSLPHHRLLKHISTFYHLELCSWKLRWFMKNEYSLLHQTYRRRHARGTSFIWEENDREAMIGCVWLGRRGEI